MATNTLEPTLDPGDNKQELWGELRPTESAAMRPSNPRPPVDEPSSKSIAFAVIVGVLLLGLALALILVRGNSDLSGVQDAALVEEESIVIDTVADEDLSDPLPDSAPLPDAEADVPVVDEPAEANPVGPFTAPSILLDNGLVSLEGGQPDQQTADRIAGEVAAIVGADNLTNNFVVDTRAPAEGSVGLLTTSDSITYVDNSFRLTDPSRRQLDLTAYVLEQNPDAVVTIMSHAASRGDAVLDVRASQTDADRLVVFFSERDIDASRIIAIGLGSANPIDAESPELPINKRTDVVISVP